MNRPARPPGDAYKSKPTGTHSLASPPAPRSGGVRRPGGGEAPGARPAPPSRGPARRPGRVAAEREGEGGAIGPARLAPARPARKRAPPVRRGAGDPQVRQPPARRPARGSPASHRASSVTSSTDTFRLETQPRGRAAPRRTRCQALAGLDQPGWKDAAGLKGQDHKQNPGERGAPSGDRLTFCAAWSPSLRSHRRL